MSLSALRLAPGTLRWLRQGRAIDGQRTNNSGRNAKSPKLVRPLPLSLVVFFGRPDSIRAAQLAVDAIDVGLEVAHPARIIERAQRGTSVAGELIHFQVERLQ